METGQEVVYTEVGEERGQEAQDGDDGGAASLPAHDDARVQVEGEHEPGDEAPDLLGVPAPVSAPGFVGPHHAEDQAAQREQGEADGHAAVADGIELFR